MKYLLDTSALLALYSEETGWEQVRAIIEDPLGSIFISALALFEFENWLRTRGKSLVDRRVATDSYVDLLDEVLPLTAEIAELATVLRDRASARIPAIDIMIAATAVAYEATLVHRDAHLEGLPPGEPNQVALPEKK